MENAIHNPVVKKYGLWIVGGVVGVYLVYRYLAGGSSASSSSGSSDYAAYAAQQGQLQVAAGNQAIAAQTEADQAAQAANQLQAQLTIATRQADTQAAVAVGNVLSNVISAQSALPIAAINAGTMANQTALTAGAEIAAAGLEAVPGSLQGAGLIMAAVNNPLDQYGKAVANSGSIAAVNSFGSNITSMVQAAQSTANQGIAAAAQRSNNTSSTIGTVALAALAFA